MSKKIHSIEDAVKKEKPTNLSQLEEANTMKTTEQVNNSESSAKKAESINDAVTEVSESESLKVVEISSQAAPTEKLVDSQESLSGQTEAETSTQENLDGDQENEKQIDATIEKYQQAFIYNPTSGMKMIQKGKYGEAFYAGLTMEGKASLDIVIQYQDGTYSPVQSFPQGKFLMAASTSFIKTKDSASGTKIQLQKFTKKFETDMYDIMRPGMCIVPFALLKIIREKYQELPVRKVECFDLEIKEIYVALAIFAFEKSKDKKKDYIVGKEHFNLTNADMAEFSKHIGIKECTVIRLLERYGLLYKTPSSIGYQNKVAHGKKRFYAYSVFRDLPLSITTQETDLDSTGSNHQMGDSTRNLI